MVNMEDKEKALSILGKAFANRENRLTYKDIGNRLRVSTSSAHNYLNGTTNIPKDKFIKLCNILEVNIQETYELYFGERPFNEHLGHFFTDRHWQPVGIQLPFWRQAELESIKKIINPKAKGEGKRPKALGICGPKGSGKTTLAEQLLCDLRKDIDGSIILSLSIDNTDETIWLDNLRYIAEYFRIQIKNWHLVQDIRKTFSDQLQSKKYVIVLDDVKVGVPWQQLTFGGSNVWFIVLAESKKVFGTSIIADNVIELKPITKDFGVFTELASPLIIDLETSLRKKSNLNDLADVWQPPENWGNLQELEKLQVLIDTHFQQLNTTIQKCYISFGVWAESRNVDIFEPVFSFMEAHALWKSIQTSHWAENDTKTVLSELQATHLITGSEEHDMYHIHSLILEDVMRRWNQQGSSDKEVASKWYMNTTFGFDISWKTSIVPIIFLLGMVAIVEISYFKIGNINTLLLSNIAFLSTILSCAIYWQKMTLLELWQALCAIINLWITPVSESTVYKEIQKHTDIHLNVKRLGYLQQVQSFSRDINVLGVLMIVMVFVTISIRVTMPMASNMVASFAILLSYVVINTMAYAIARQVQLHRRLTTIPKKQNFKPPQSEN